MQYLGVANIALQIEYHHARKKNAGGLIYADLVFAKPPKGQKRLVIHGLDDMTEYAEVDLTKKTDPLPDSDEEKEIKTK
ncbi:hypothetical protein MAR_021179 [Mya arenaria]|uniref:Uncharacterized protein n=1 Tax=Mya arenaria TaxID=6604 RepID=A0ABY7E6Z1_MYAAR|nr:hypothetical protein MAR_021179 [Mya arenaria]